VPTPITGPFLRLRNGELACQYELNKPYDDPAPWRHSSILQFSSDSFKTCAHLAVVSHDPANRIFFWDQRPTVLPDGSLLNMFWTYDRSAGTYLNIHGRRSQDGGRTWSEMYDTGVPGQPAPPVALKDGRLAMAYVDRTASPAIKLRLSGDQGRTWPTASETLLVTQSATAPAGHSDMREAWAEMSRFSLGLPATALTRSGEIVVVYYAGPETDSTGIHWLKIGLSPAV
jgi:hypothetical protein